jgi:predicted component of type VI protein secretion system
MKLSLLVMTPGFEQGKVIAVDRSPFLIGRDPNCHLRPGSGKISKRHCALVIRSGQAFVSDLGSTNGTFLNDFPVHTETAMQSGDRLRVGPLVFDVIIDDTQPVEKPAAPEAPPTVAPASIEDEAASVLLGELPSVDAPTMADKSRPPKDDLMKTIADARKGPRTDRSGGRK